MDKVELCMQHANRLEKIQDDVTEIKVDVSKINTTLEFQQQILSGQQEILKDHIKRTEINEKRLQKLEVPYLIIAWIATPIGVLASIAAILNYIGIL